MRTYSGSTLTGQFVSQFFFDDAVTDTVFASAPYNTRGSRDTRNAVDMVYTGAAHASRSLLTLTKTSQGYAASIDTVATLDSGGGGTPTGMGTRFAIPHVAYGGGWYTGLYLTNINSSQASATVALYGEDGSQLNVPGLGRGPGGPPPGGGGPGAGGSGGATLASNATLLIELSNTGNLTSGWMDLTLPPGVVGYAVLRQSVQDQADQETVIPLNTVASQNADLIYDDTVLNTWVAIANPGTSSITVNATAYKDDGSQLGSASLTLGARGKSAVSLRTLDGLGGVAGTRGRVTLSTVTGSMAVMGLRVGAAAFPEIPVNYR